METGQIAPVRGRFAPSPSGRMHLGNLLAALLAWLDVRSLGGTMVLRMEDLDPDRCGREYADLLADDLNWLGLTWDEGWDGGEAGMGYAQSTRTIYYEECFERLQQEGLVYPCWCSRAERLAAAAPHAGQSEPAHDCRCRSLSEEKRQALEKQGRKPAYLISVPHEYTEFTDGHYGAYRQELFRERGDLILRRSDGVYAYQLAVTADDGAMGITRVVRGRDLLPSTPRQIWLHRLLGFTPPEYCHVPLVLAPDGRRLSKRERDLDMSALRRRFTPAELTGHLAHLAGLLPEPEPLTAGQLIPLFSWSEVRREDIVLDQGSLYTPISLEKADFS